MSDDVFKPERLAQIKDGYRKDPLSNAYADAWGDGLWVKEWASEREGRAIAAVGSVYALQKLEKEHEIEIDVADLSLGDCVSLSVPGSGSTREEAVRDGIAQFKTSSLWAQHEEWHKEANNE